MADTIHIRLARSPIGTTQRVRQTLRGLGLVKVGDNRKLEGTPQVLGMVRRVLHLIEQIKE
jgi:large subunit ribosomal protein L30